LLSLLSGLAGRESESGMTSRLPLLLGGLAAFAAGGTLAALGAASPKKQNGDGSEPADPASSPPKPVIPSLATFNAIAPAYDARIDREEFFMGIPLLRRYLIRKARGHVLEVACGTGRNLPYYPPPPAVTSLTLADPAAGMLAVAAAAAEDRGGGEGSSPPVALVQVAAEELTTAAGPLIGPPSARWPAPRLAPPHGRVPPATFDTVIDTFGLCSMADPVAGLRQLAAACAPGGRILLLEHGRSGAWGWLDAGAASHAARWGCAWNRDVRGAVGAAGLEVVSASTWHFGTTHVLELRVPTPSPKRGRGQGGDREVERRERE